MLCNDDNGVLPVRLGAVVTQNCALYHIVELKRRERKCRMLGNGDDGVLSVRLGAVVTQTVLYITPIGKRKGGTLLCTKF